jgi:hypothetical protein
MAPQASKKCCLLPPHHLQIGSCTSNSIDSEQIPGTFSVLTISSLSPQASAQSENGSERHFRLTTYKAYFDVYKPQDRASVSVDSDLL